jgi:hypothetical protein
MAAPAPSPTLTPTQSPTPTLTPTHTPSSGGATGPVARLHEGDARQFGTPPEIVAYANVIAKSPPSGVTFTSVGSLWRFNEWIALRQQGDWIEATYSGTTTAVGVELWGDMNDGWARVLVDGAEVWRGSTYGSDANWPGGAFVRYLQVSGLTLGSHTVRVENLGVAGAGGGDDVALFFFGFGPAAP